MTHADPELDPLLARELARLPGPRAPQTLLPRVLAATTQRPAATGWFTWPRHWQAASVAALLALVAGFTWLVSMPPAPVSGVAESAGQTATTVRVLWDVVIEPAVTYVAIVAMVLTLVCAAAWAALDLALGGASHR